MAVSPIYLIAGHKNSNNSIAQHGSILNRQSVNIFYYLLVSSCGFKRQTSDKQATNQHGETEEAID